jgi:2',3'-cyclic-nucleotide 2'-phosphodiesterase/3'-nucleotidase/5'-nucleotidase
LLPVVHTCWTPLPRARRGRGRARVASLAGTAVVLAFASCAPRQGAPERGAAAAAADTVRLTLMGTTDLHGRVHPLDPLTGGPAAESLAAVATLVDSIRAADPLTLLVDSGDLLQGNAFTTFFAREDTAWSATGGVHPVIAAMNELGYDASAIGNHEFNYGLPFLNRALAGARFPFVAANVVEAGTGRPLHPPYVVKQVGPVRVGILGLTTPGVNVWDRRHVEGRVEVLDLAESAARWLPRLLEEKPDLVVVTAHSGLGPGSTYGETLAPRENDVLAVVRAHPEVDVVFFGHTHRDTPGERADGALLLQAEKWGRRLAVAHLTLARESRGGWRVTASEGRTISTAGVAPSDRLAAVVEPAMQRALAWVRRPIGRSAAEWTSTRARFVDLPITDLVQRVQLDATGAELSSTAVYDTAAAIPGGTVTIGHVSALYPYENSLEAIRITGRQLRDYLEQSARYFRRTCADGRVRVEGGLPECIEAPLPDPDVPGYNYDVVAGVDYVLDVSRPAGERVIELERDRRPVRDGDVFTLAVNGYRGGGGGGFTALAGAPVVAAGREDVRGLIVDWIRRRGTIRPADVHDPNWRIVPEAAVEPAAGPPREGSGSGRGAGASCPARADSLVHLTVLSTNDLHGALEGRVQPWSGGRTVGGAAILAATIAEERAENPEGTLLLDGGDMMQGTPISNLVQGASVIDVMNAAGYDAAAIGNHEFDWEIPVLRERMEQADFPFLSANILSQADGSRPPWAVPSTIVERKGLRIGVIGLTTQTTPYTTLPQHVRGWAFTDLADAVNREVPALEAQGADVIVVLAHAGGFQESETGLYRGEIVEAMERMSPAVDLVVSGHTHTLLSGEVNGIPLVQARSSGTAVAVADLWVDAATGDVACAETEVRTTFADAVAPDPAVQAIVERWQERVGVETERVIARAGHRLDTDRRRESVLGDLIADGQRIATGAQVALQNSGGIRAAVEAGPIRWRDAFEVQPFGNVLYRFRLPGRTLIEALENGVRGDHGIVQVSGVRLAVDVTARPGARVRDVTLEDGTPVHPDSSYVVATNNFMAQGGDGYTMLRDAPDVENTRLLDLDVFVDYLQRLPQPIRYERQGRIRFVGGDSLPRAPEGTR